METLFQAIYDSQDQVPDQFRRYFESKNGKWQLREDAIPGVGDLFNKGIADNRDRAMDQLKTKTSEVTTLQEKIRQLESRGSDIPAGAVVLQGDDVKSWNKYTSLGTPKDLDKIVKENEELRSKVGKIELTESVGRVAKATGLNNDVLVDLASSSIEGKSFSFLTKKEKNEKDEDVDVAYVKVSTPNGNQVEVTEHKLLDFAKENLPEWKYNALTNVTPGTTQPQQTTSGGVRMPKLGSAQTKPTGGDQPTRAADKFNAERAQAPNPFQPAATGTK